jgi:hypothetical protein
MYYTLHITQHNHYMNTTVTLVAATAVAEACTMAHHTSATLHTTQHKHYIHLTAIAIALAAAHLRASDVEVEGSAHFVKGLSHIAGNFFHVGHCHSRAL